MNAWKREGLVVYRGPSLIDGTPIRALLTGRSKNRKLGNMVQLTILVDGMTPVDAARSGTDHAVCGDCPYRGELDPITGRLKRGCYVILSQGPTAIAKKDERRGYPNATPASLKAFLAGRKVRLGMYGNPSAMPYKRLRLIAQASQGWTGYTADWRNCDPQFSDMLMASTQSPQATRQAWRKGWRTFRSAPAKGFKLLPGEVECPAKSGVQCIDCLACCGTHFGTRKKAVSIAIKTHGNGLTHANQVATNK